MIEDQTYLSQKTSCFLEPSNIYLLVFAVPGLDLVECNSCRSNW